MRELEAGQREGISEFGRHTNGIFVHVLCLLLVLFSPTSFVPLPPHFGLGKPQRLKSSLLVDLATIQHPEHKVMKQRFSSLDVKVENILSRSVKYVMLIRPRLLLMSCLGVFVHSELQIFMICPQYGFRPLMAKFRYL